MTTQTKNPTRTRELEKAFPIKIMNAQYLNLVCTDRVKGEVFINNKKVEKREIYRFRLLSNNPEDWQSQLLQIKIVGSPEETKKWLWGMHQKNYKLGYTHETIAKKFKNATGERLVEKQEWTNYLRIVTMVRLMWKSGIEYPEYPIILINNEAVRPVAEAIVDYCYYYLDRERNCDATRGPAYTFSYGGVWTPNY